MASHADRDDHAGPAGQGTYVPVGLGHHMCFSVIVRRLVPIVAASFGLPAVVLVGAIAYLIGRRLLFVLIALSGKRPAPREAAGAAAGGPADADGCTARTPKQAPRSLRPLPRRRHLHGRRVAFSR